MDLILLASNDIILSDIQYSFTKTYPYIMIHFFDENDEKYDANKYLFEIAKYRNESITITKDSTIEEIQNLFNESFGINIKIAGYRDDKAVYIDSEFTLKEINEQLKNIQEFSPYPIYNVGLRVFPDPNDKEKLIVKHLDGEDVIIDERILKSDANNLILFKGADNFLYAINALNMEVLHKKKIQ